MSEKAMTVWVDENLNKRFAPGRGQGLGEAYRLILSWPKPGEPVPVPVPVKPEPVELNEEIFTTKEKEFDFIEGYPDKTVFSVQELMFSDVLHRSDRRSIYLVMQDGLVIFAGLTAAIEFAIQKECGINFGFSASPMGLGQYILDNFTRSNITVELITGDPMGDRFFHVNQRVELDNLILKYRPMFNELDIEECEKWRKYNSTGMTGFEMDVRMGLGSGLPLGGA